MKLPDNINKGLHAFSKKLGATIAKAGRGRGGGDGSGGNGGGSSGSDNVNIDFSNVAYRVAQILLGEDPHVDSNVKIRYKNKNNTENNIKDNAKNNTINNNKYKIKDNDNEMS